MTLPNDYIDGQWHHGVVTFDNTNNIVRLFVDGVQIATLSPPLILIILEPNL